MNIAHTIQEVRAQVKAWQQAGLSIGFVPTMGFLYEGHAALIRQARDHNDKVVVSVFVNPTQFGPTEDLAAYPRDLERDTALCREQGVDLIFHPSAEEMYCQPKAYVDITELSQTLCGQTRPIHFKGVCTVVTKLFNIVTPDRAYFGEKDAQQLAIIRKMVNDLNIPVAICSVPIVREADGLAKSSRNTYLSAAERQAATVLYRAIEGARHVLEQAAGKVDCAEVLAVMKRILDSEVRAKIDYVSAVDADTMQPVDSFDKPVLIAMAVYIGKTRLIDNFTYRPAQKG